MQQAIYELRYVKDSFYVVTDFINDSDIDLKNAVVHNEATVLNSDVMLAGVTTYALNAAQGLYYAVAQQLLNSKVIATVAYKQ